MLPPGVMTWRGSKLSVPGDVPAALEQRYGADWRVPRYMVRPWRQQGDDARSMHLTLHPSRPGAAQPRFAAHACCTNRLPAAAAAPLLPSQDKGADVVEGQKLYARIFRALSNLGIRI